jgi:hypothetical protein
MLIESITGGHPNEMTDYTLDIKHFIAALATGYKNGGAMFVRGPDGLIAYRLWLNENEVNELVKAVKEHTPK